ncbi:MAG: hypothetical protein QG584_2533, partial [Pseudomonadota bacterium]|nr:hypothetical protein [Pseudomonadota bacterium]
ITKYQDRPRTIRLRGEWVAMDPRGWDADMDVTVNVGLGTGTRDRDIAMLMGVRNAQKEYVGVFGPFNEFCNIGHISDTDRKMAEAAGLSNPDSYFPNISQEKIAEMRAQSAQKPPPPDPRMMEMQAKLQLQQAELKADIERKNMEAASDARLAQEKALIDLNAARERSAMQMQADRERGQQEIQLMREKAAAQIELDREIAVQKASLKREEMLLEAQLTREANAMQMIQRPPVADTNITAPGV